MTSEGDGTGSMHDVDGEDSGGIPTEEVRRKKLVLEPNPAECWQTSPPSCWAVPTPSSLLYEK